MLRATKRKTCRPFSSIWQPSSKLNVLLFCLWFKINKDPNLLSVKIVFMESETQANVPLTK